MKSPALYRRRLIPDECIPLKDDIILECTSERIVTSWKAVRPKKDLHHGYSCYFLREGIKVSKFYYEDGRLLYWYCDIVDYVYDENLQRLTVVDLLADVIVKPDGTYKVVDLDEMGDALSQGLLSAELLNNGLHRLDWLLKQIYTGRFGSLQAVLEKYEKRR